jgi:hypothetical protein
VTANIANLHYYIVYGLELQSTIALPQLVSGGNGGDIQIALGQVNAPEPTGNRLEAIQLSDTKAMFLLPGVGAARIENGQRVVVEPGKGIDERRTSLFLVEIVLALVMLQRGHLVLKGSAVTAQNGVIGFIGHAGTGKSVVAAAFHKQKFPVVSDSQLVFQKTNFSPTYPSVLPGYPQLQLWPDDARLIGIAPEKLRQIRPDVSKVIWPAHETFNSEAGPVKSLYVLSRENTLGAEKYTLRDAFLELIRYTYAGHLATQKVFNQADHFTQCMRIVKSVPVYRLQIPKRGLHPDDIVELVLQNES